MASTLGRGEPFWALCECGKRGYSSRKDALSVGKRVHPGATIAAYDCEEAAEWRDAMWHYGNTTHKRKTKGRK